MLNTRERENRSPGIYANIVLKERNAEAGIQEGFARRIVQGFALPVMYMRTRSHRHGMTRAGIPDIGWPETGIELSFTFCHQTEFQ